MKLENEYKDLAEKVKIAKKAAEDAKKRAKALKIKTGAGSETENELADEELGIDEKADKKDEDKGEDSGKSRKIIGAGASVVQFTLEKKEAAELLVSKMFKQLLIADSQIQSNNFERMFMNYKKETTENDVTKIRVVTSDDRVPALIRFIQKNDPNEQHKEALDIIATRLIGGSKEYIKWVKA